MSGGATTLIGRFRGRAWTPPLILTGAPAAAHVTSWVITAPWAHPVWSQYVLDVIHLRDIEGAAPAHLYGPTATHEAQLWALDPKLPIAEGETLPAHARLTPQNFVGQWACESDDAARLYVRERVVDAIMAGNLSPDTDHRRAWIARFPFHDYGVS